MRPFALVEVAELEFLFLAKSASANQQKCLAVTKNEVATRFVFDSRISPRDLVFFAPGSRLARLRTNVQIDIKLS